VEMISSPDLTTNIDEESFHLRNIWGLSAELEVFTFEHKGLVPPGGGAPNMYPAVNIAVRVARHTTYYLFNIVVAMGLFSLMAILAPLAMPYHAGSDRLGIALTLVLTAAAYKLAISTMVPTVSYLTLLDKYILEQGAIISLVTLENILMASSSENGPLKQVFSGYSLSLKDRKSRQLTTTTSSSASTSTASSGAGTPLIPDGLGSSTEDDGSHKLDLILLTVILGLWSLSQIKMAFIWYSKTSKRSSQTGYFRENMTSAMTSASSMMRTAKVEPAPSAQSSTVDVEAMRSKDTMTVREA